MNLTNFTSLVDHTKNFNAVPITSRIHDGIINELRIHKIKKSDMSMLDKNLQMHVEQIYNNYGAYLSNSLMGLTDKITKEFKEQLIQQYYMIDQQKRIRYDGFDYNNLLYIIELKITGENSTHLGDKFANRYASKGVASLILPNELRPYALESKQPVDVIQGSLSVISRMNFGQVLEGTIAKAIVQSENSIKQDPSTTFTHLLKIANIAQILNDNDYAQQIRDLAYDIKGNPDKQTQFINSVNNMGLYFEAPNFASFSLPKLRECINTEFGIHQNEPILIRKETIKYMNEKLKLNIALPQEDIVIPNIYTAPIYTIKLKQESHSKIASRDLGSYKITSRQPIQGKSKNGIIGGGSRVGSMEFDGMLAHSVPRAIKELRTVKNDSHVLKLDLILQMITHGYYDMPEAKQTTSYTKMMIDSLIAFIND